MPFTLAIVASVLAWTWWLAPKFPTSAVSVIVLAVIALAARHDARRREWGFNWRALPGGLVYAMTATVPLAGIMVTIGAGIGTLHDRRDFLGSFGALFVWGLGQQWVLQTVLLRESQRATSSRIGIVVAAVLFAALHLPNPFLTVVTLISALLWCAIYDRFPNVVPLAISHALGSLAILYAFDESITGRLRVGVSYLMLDR